MPLVLGSCRLAERFQLKQQLCTVMIKDVMFRKYSIETGSVYFKRRSGWTDLDNSTAKAGCVTNAQRAHFAP